MNFVVIETARLILKGLTPEDMQYIFDRWPKTEIKKALGHRSDDDFTKEETKVKNGYASYNRRFLLFLMEHKETGAIFGRCGLHNWNKDHQRAELGYSIEVELFKRQGYMTEAVEAVLDYGFNQLKLNRMEALVGTTNIPSLKIMEKFDFVKEGMLRQHYLTDQFEDSFAFSKLASEYFSKKTSH